MMMKSKPSFEEEQILWNKGYEFVVGVDEVGRGAFAGPVTAAAVVFPQNILESKNPLLFEINDSKLLLPKRRKVLSDFISSVCLFSTISTVPVQVINKVGIGKAGYKAFRNVLFEVCMAFDHAKTFALVDGFYIPRVKNISKAKQKPLIKGDRKSISIAAASIIAKVHRDNLMEQFHTKYQIYNFARNKGYGTKSHREKIKIHGLCKLHRTSFDLSKFLPTSA